MATPNNEKPIIVAFTLDFETGGLDCQDCACTQIAIHAVRIDTFETIDRYANDSDGAINIFFTLFDDFYALYERINKAK